MYMSKANRERARRYEEELRIVGAIQKRLRDGNGWCRITMKADGQEIDIALCGEKYHVSFPCYYGDRDYGMEAPYKPLDKWFSGLDDVANFIQKKEWQRTW